MKLVIPIASRSRFFPFDDYYYPKPLIEVAGKPMIQHVIENLTLDNPFKSVLFLARSEDCSNYHIEDTLKLLSPESITLKLQGETLGALCSLMLAIDHIHNEEPIVISNSDQIIDFNIRQILDQFMESELDAACITFRSFHPRWSYVRVDCNGHVVEVAEKRPISSHAIAGFYMFKHGTDFIQYATSVIRKGASTEGLYYTSSVFNEFILDDKAVGHFPIPTESYHTFYTPQKILEYEMSTRRTA